MSDSSSSVGIAPPDYRLPEAIRLGRVQLQVADLARSLAFYKDILGFRVLDHPAGRAVLGVEEEEGTSLVELVERPGTQSVAPRGRLGLFHVAFRLPDRAGLARFVRHLRKTDLQPGMSDHRVSEAVYLRDPDGLGIEVYADRPRDTWAYSAEGEISMTTEPLDVASLLNAGGEEEWTEAPAGTAVGHVHLHVGDLDRASAFYHETLGFDRVVWSYPGALFLSAGGYHHHLGTNVWAGDVPPPGEDEAQLLEWTLVLPQSRPVDAVARSLDRAGYDVSESPEEDSVIVADPWGTTLRIAPADG